MLWSLQAGKEQTSKPRKEKDEPCHQESASTNRNPLGGPPAKSGPPLGRLFFPSSIYK